MQERELSFEEFHDICQKYGLHREVWISPYHIDKNDNILCYIHRKDFKKSRLFPFVLVNLREMQNIETFSYRELQKISKTNSSTKVIHYKNLNDCLLMLPYEIKTPNFLIGKDEKEKEKIRTDFILSEIYQDMKKEKKQYQISYLKERNYKSFQSSKLKKLDLVSLDNKSGGKHRFVSVINANYDYEIFHFITEVNCSEDYKYLKLKLKDKNMQNKYELWLNTHKKRKKD